MDTILQTVFSNACSRMKRFVFSYSYFVELWSCGSNEELAIIGLENGLGPNGRQNITCSNGPLTRYVKLRVRMRWECRERFPRHGG